MNLIYILALSFTTVVYSAPLSENAVHMVNQNTSEYRMGDMVFTSDPMSRTAKLNVKKWTNGVIPYVFKSVFTTAHKNLITTTMRSMESVTANCIKFKVRTTETDYVTIEDTIDGCWSYIGRRGGSQTLSLEIKGNCVDPGTVIHEFLHALGVAHEQNRNDRDNYVTIMTANIQKGQEHNFNKLDATVSGTFGETYDFQSIMHYRYNEFSVSRTKPTIVPKSSAVDMYNIGGLTKMTAKDVRKLKKFYGCPV